jgi:diaminopimelate decarboxylase
MTETPEMTETETAPPVDDASETRDALEPPAVGVGGETGAVLERVAREIGTPAFVYFWDHVVARVGSLRRAYGGLMGVSYAMKCNPHPEFLRRMRGLVDTLDVSSGGELSAGLAAGWEPERISFTGPAKRDPELEAAVAAGREGIGEVIVESPAEALRLDRIAHRLGRRPGVLIRIAPARVPKGFGSTMSGRPTQFGFDEEDLEDQLPAVLSLPNLRFRGFHIYSGTQCLRPDAIAENYRIFIDLFRRTAARFDLRPAKLIFGSGMGIPYHEGDRPVSPSEVAELALPSLMALKAEPRFAGASMLLETGRFLVGEAGIYLTRVVGRKDSRGRRLAVCDGGMNHHLGACGLLGMVLHKNYRIFKVGAPRERHVPAPADPGGEAFDLYGPLCTSVDRLGSGVKLPGLEIGDVVGVHCSGAYGATASPVGFISHPRPFEVLVETRGGRTAIDDISRKG